MSLAKRLRSGFTILELLVVVAILGIIAALVMWNYFTAVQRARQKRTMADMRSVSVAWEARALDVRAYNGAAQTFMYPANSITYPEIGTMLAPTYMKLIPQNDAWNRPLQFATDQPLGSSMAATTYAIRSAGRDGVFESSYTLGTTTSFDCDIVYSNGAFIVYPEGMQGR
ncbi:MAG TPA: prepilin-type N-terminal cleavage/methylation domain-containing protein [Thermoanaerobaculia bacterium]|nr:prepilin-type N-terminal cleavage/methylation domain-containing protein [Thermoanaerobaculia bacterium]